MKKYILTAVVMVMMAAVCSTASAQKKDKKQKTDTPAAVAPAIRCATNTDTISYIIAKTDTLFTKEQIGQIMQAWQQAMSTKKMAQSEQENTKNVKAGNDFLAANKLKEGVIETASGLQYKIIKEGTGLSPHDSDMVSVHYTGTLIDGTKFDSSRDRGEPIEFPVNGVIPGWTEALKLMKPGAQYMLYIPAKLGYGDKATGPIPAGSTLIFDVELLEFENKK